ncbi:MAG: hypothetical protein ACO3A4_05730 [Silvanigrellaceae bacterium]
MIGLEKIRSVIDSSLGTAQHHAYLFIGSSFAADSTPTELVGFLLDKLAGLRLLDGQRTPNETEFWESFQRHPDLLRADSERAILRKDDVELFRERSLYPPTFARRRFFLIERAERMNNQSANALLKTLEEPLSQCVFVLTTSRPGQLPSTISSRCQKIPLPVWDSANRRAMDDMEPEDAEFLKKIFSATHLTTPPVITSQDNLSSVQKTSLSPKKLGELTQWSDSTGRKYAGQLLRDAVVENTSDSLKSGTLSQTRATMILAEINRWADAEPFNPTNSFWLVRILLTLAI